jgi:hypothetical protein
MLIKGDVQTWQADYPMKNLKQHALDYEHVCETKDHSGILMHNAFSLAVQ